MKKSLFLTSGVIILLISFWVGYRIHKNNIYEKEARTFLITASKSYKLTKYASDMLLTYWGTAIQGGEIKDLNGEMCYVSDINKAIEYAYLILTSEQVYSVLEDLNTELTSQMKTLNSPPKKYEKLNVLLLEIYNNINEYTELIKGHRLNYIQFGERISDLNKTLNTKLKETCLYLTDISDISDISDIKAKDIISEYINKKYATYKKQNEDFATNFSRQRGVKSLISSQNVFYREINKGLYSKKIEDENIVIFHYELKDIKGNIIDSSYDKKNPQCIKLSDIKIEGLYKAIKEMNIGSIWEIVIKSDEAYKDRKVEKIKPFSTIVAKVELLDVKNE